MTGTESTTTKASTTRVNRLQTWRASARVKFPGDRSIPERASRRVIVDLTNLTRCRQGEAVRHGLDARSFVFTRDDP